MKYIDLTFEITTGMKTCGTKWHQEVDIKQLGKIDVVGRNTHKLILGSHTGTHVDAPFHFIQSGKTIEDLDINILCGSINIVDFRRFKQGDTVSLEDVKQLEVSDRMLFVFGWFYFWDTDQYYCDFPYFSEESVDYLISKGMKLIAMDTPSPDSGNSISNNENDSPNHKRLLSNQIVVLEYLTNTSSIDMSKKYDIYALPLKIKGSDGSPARVIIKELEE